MNLDYYTIRFIFINSPSLYINDVPNDRVGYSTGGNSVFDNTADKPGTSMKLYKLKQAKTIAKRFMQIAKRDMKSGYIEGILKIDLIPVKLLFGDPIIL